MPDSPWECLCLGGHGYGLGDVGLRIGKKESGRNQLQLWQVCLSEGKTISCKAVIFHDYGTAWDLQWCPELMSSTKVIMGVLAVCFGDGSFRLTAIPTCFDTKAVKWEKCQMKGDIPNRLACRIAWDGSNRVVTGHSDGISTKLCAKFLGSVVLWDVEALWSTPDRENKAIPLSIFPLHDGCISALDILRINEHKLTILSCAYDGNTLLTDSTSPWSAHELHRSRGVTNACQIIKQAGNLYTDFDANTVVWIKGASSIHLASHRAFIWSLSWNQRLGLIGSVAADGTLAISRLETNKKSQMEIILELGWTEQDQVYHVQLRRAQRVVYSINQKDLLFPKQVALHKVVALFGHMTYAKQVPSSSYGQNVKISVPPASFAAGCSDQPVVFLTYKAQIEKLGVQGIYILPRSEYEKIIAASNKNKFDAASLTSSPLEFNYNERLSCLLPPSSPSSAFVNSCEGSQTVADSAASPLCVGFLNSGTSTITVTLGVSWRFADGKTNSKVAILQSAGGVSSSGLQNGDEQALFIPTYMVVIACAIALVGVTVIALLVRNRVNQAKQDMRRYEPEMLASPKYLEKAPLYESPPSPPLPVSHSNPLTNSVAAPVHHESVYYVPPPPLMHPPPPHPENYYPAEGYIPQFPPPPSFGHPPPGHSHHPQFMPPPPPHFASPPSQFDAPVYPTNQQ